MGSAQSHRCELEGGDDSPVCCLLVTLSFSRVFISWPPLFAFCSVSKWLRVNSSRSSRHAGMPWAVQKQPLICLHPLFPPVQLGQLGSSVGLGGQC